MPINMLVFMHMLGGVDYLLGAPMHLYLSSPLVFVELTLTSALHVHLITASRSWWLVKLNQFSDGNPWNLLM